jgi:hypothetical protein
MRYSAPSLIEGRVIGVLSELESCLESAYLGRATGLPGVATSYGRPAPQHATSASDDTIRARLEASVVLHAGVALASRSMTWAYSSVGLEHTPDKREVSGSSPLRPTNDLILIGGVAQLGERLVCNQKVAGSIPVTSTTNHTAASQPMR